MQERDFSQGSYFESCVSAEAFQIAGRREMSDGARRYAAETLTALLSDGYQEVGCILALFRILLLRRIAWWWNIKEPWTEFFVYNFVCVCGVCCIKRISCVGSAFLSSSCICFRETAGDLLKVYTPAHTQASIYFAMSAHCYSLSSHTYKARFLFTSSHGTSMDRCENLSLFTSHLFIYNPK